MSTQEEGRGQSGHLIPDEWREKIVAQRGDTERDPNLIVTTDFSIPNTEITYKLVLAEKGNGSELEPGVYVWTNILESKLPESIAESARLNQTLGHCVWQQLETFEKGHLTRPISVSVTGATQRGEVLFSVEAH